MVNELSERISSEINFENQFFYTKQVTKESRKNRETSKKKKEFQNAIFNQGNWKTTEWVGNLRRETK